MNTITTPVEVGKYYVRFQGKIISTNDNLFDAVTVLRRMGLKKDSGTHVDVVRIVEEPADWAELDMTCVWYGRRGQVWHGLSRQGGTGLGMAGTQ